MAHQSAPPCVGIHTADPVACRALRLLLGAAGYAATCLRGWDGSIRDSSGLDLIVVVQPIGGEDRGFPSAGAGVPILHLVGDGQAPPDDLSSSLPWPSSTGELVRAIEAARRP